MSSQEVVAIDSDDEDISDDDEDYDDEDNAENDCEFTDGPSNMDLSRAARDHLREIYDILQAREDVNYKNALEMNQEMQKRLLEVREQITTLQAKITERFATNEAFLKDSIKRKRNSMTDGTFGKISRGEKFYIKGSIYFKDVNKRNAPNNEDYLERQRNGEMFPMDCELTSRHVWSITDKMSIIKAIKEQIYDDKALRKRFKNKNQKLEDMLKVCEKTLNIDWVQISVHNLRHRHTPTSCKAMFEVYLHPSLKHDAFAEEENQLLAQAVEKFNFQNWAAIAAEVGRRSDYQCFLHYHTTPSFRAPYERWDKRADELLLKAVEASKCNGVINWSQIVYLFPYKSRTSLQQRYHYCLNPAISHAPFTGEEDLLLLAAVREYGTNFAKFPRSLFPNRTVIQVRNRYYNALETRHKACPWTLDDDKILLKFVEEHGMQWKHCSEVMEHRHTRTSCRQRYVVIQNNFKKNPNFNLEDLVRRANRKVSSSVTTENWLEKIEELRANPALTVEETTAPVSKSRKRKKLEKPKEPPPKKKRNLQKPIYVERLRQCGILFHNFFKYAYNFRFGKPTQYTPNELYTDESQQAMERLGFHMPGEGEPKLYGESSLSKFTSLHINGLFMPAQRRHDLANFIKRLIPRDMILEPDGRQLAPTYSTLVALRAMCVLSADTAKEREDREQPSYSKASNTADSPTVTEIKTENENEKTAQKSEENEKQNEIKIKQEIKVEANVEGEEPSSSSAAVVRKILSTEEFNNTPAVVRFRKRFRALFYKAACMSRLPPASIPIKPITETSLSTSTHNVSTNLVNLKVEQPAPTPPIAPLPPPNVKLEPQDDVESESSSFFEVSFIKKENDLDHETENCAEFV